MAIEEAAGLINSVASVRSSFSMPLPSQSSIFSTLCIVRCIDIIINTTMSSFNFNDSNYYYSNTLYMKDKLANRDDYVVVVGLFCWSVGSMKLVVAS